MDERKLKGVERFNDGSFTYYITNSNQERADIVKSSFVGKTRLYNVSFDDYDEVAVYPVASEIIDNYGKVPKEKIKAYINEELDKIKGTISLNGMNVLYVLLHKYFDSYSLDSTKDYSFSYEVIIDNIMYLIKNICDNHSSIKLDYGREIINNTDYRNISMQLRGIINYLLNDYKNVKDIEEANKLALILDTVNEKMNTLIRDINENARESISHSIPYKKNQKRINKELRKILDDRILDLIDYKDCNIDLTLFISLLPYNIVFEAANDLFINEYKFTLNKVYAVADLVCRNQKGNKYSKDVINKILLAYYERLNVNSPELIKECEEKMDKDRSKFLGKKLKYSFEPYYDYDDMDDYEDDIPRGKSF